MNLFEAARGYLKRRGLRTEVQKHPWIRLQSGYSILILHCHLASRHLVGSPEELLYSVFFISLPVIFSTLFHGSSIFCREESSHQSLRILFLLSSAELYQYKNTEGDQSSWYGERVHRSIFFGSTIKSMNMHFVLVKKSIIEWWFEEVPGKGIADIHRLFENIAKTSSKHDSSLKAFFPCKWFLERLNVSETTSIVSSSQADCYSEVQVVVLFMFKIFISKIILEVAFGYCDR